jgi:hypothetical protein
MTRDEVLRRIADRINEYLPEMNDAYYRGYLNALSWVEDLLLNDALDGAGALNDGSPDA